MIETCALAAAWASCCLLAAGPNTQAARLHCAGRPPGRPCLRKYKAALLGLQLPGVRVQRGSTALQPHCCLIHSVTHARPRAAASVHVLLASRFCATGCRGTGWQG